MSIVTEGHRDLLKNFLDEDQLKECEIGNELSEEQRIIFENFKKGENILILAAAGTGKSYLIKTIQEYNLQFAKETNYKRLYLTATTGVAAYNLNFSDNLLASSGMTIHSFLGIGTGTLDIYSLIKKIKKNRSIVNVLISDHILVIDEISLLSASLFEKINLIYRHFRNSTEVFGGIQVILTGDFLQTEAIFNEPTYSHEVVDKRLLFESDLFNEIFPKPSILTKNYRQKGDTKYYDLLSRIRIGKHTQEDMILLNEKTKNFHSDLKKLDITPIHLVISNAEAQNINKKNMDNIKEKYINYDYTSTSFGQNTDLIEILKKDLIKQFTTKGLLKLQLKIGARVMLIKNLDVLSGLINGSMGKISHLGKNEIIVDFDNGKSVGIARNEWKLEMDNCFVKFKQFPLICSYAITIHKSISLTLDYTICDLNRAFCNHLVYLALSRIVSFDKLLLKTFNADKITVNHKILKYLGY
jgi:ATP-dependent DNA helicase PIF1